MDGVDRIDRRPLPPDSDPTGRLARANGKQAAANAANNEWLPAFVDDVPIKYPATLLNGGAGTTGATLAATTDEIVRLQNAKPVDGARLRELQSAWVAKAHAAGMKEPPASFSPWTASDSELGSAFLFTHVGGVLPLDAVRHDGGVHFKEDIFEAVALRTRGLDDAVIDSYAGDPGTQRVILERELRRLGDASQCKGDEPIEALRLRRAKLVNGVEKPEADRALYMGLDGKVGTFDALVDYELEQRVLAANPGTTLGTMTATVAAVRGGDTDRIRAAGQLGNAAQNLAGAAAGLDQAKLRGPIPTGDIRGRPMGLNDKHLGGEVRNGRAVGFHHEPSASGGARLVAGTMTKPNAMGLYMARVEVRDDAGRWIEKPHESTFFPKHWTRPQVRTAILEAFANRVDRGGGNWTGKTSAGMRITGHSDARGVIDSAYPIMERE